MHLGSRRETPQRLSYRELAQRAPRGAYGGCPRRLRLQRLLVHDAVAERRPSSGRSWKNMFVMYERTNALGDPPCVNPTPGDSHLGAFQRLQGARRLSVRDERFRPLV